jgi:hypothetical protein
MKPVMFKNRVNGERFVCEDTRAVEQIDGVEYLTVVASSSLVLHPRPD